MSPRDIFETLADDLEDAAHLVRTLRAENERLKKDNAALSAVVEELNTQLAVEKLKGAP